MGLLRIEELMVELDQRLGQRDCEGEIIIMGDASLVYPHGIGPWTLDYIEAITSPVIEIGDIAVEMASELGLDRGWLRESEPCRSRISSESFEPVLELEHLTVFHPSDLWMLASRFDAAFKNEDMADAAAFFAKKMGITNADELLNLLSVALPNRRCGPYDKLVAEELVKHKFPPFYVPSRYDFELD